MEMQTIAGQHHLLAPPGTAADLQLSPNCGGMNLKPLEQRNKHPIKRQRSYGEAVTRDRHGPEGGPGFRVLTKRKLPLRLASTATP